ncbi:MAG: hypothetical protein P8Q97_03325 [Myxococcota bacterium]|nr:hypothetical protein [Myxococcota bacterium]
MKARVLRGLVMAGLCLGIVGESWGRDLFVFDIELDGGEAAASSTNSFLQVGDLFDESSLIDLFGADYEPETTGVTGNLDLRGVATRLVYDANLVSLRFEIVGTGFEIEFADGTTRDENEADFQAWLQGDDGEGTVLNALLREFVASSPVDPVAGNPNSLESRMFDGDFELGSMGPFLSDFPTGTEDVPNLWKFDFNFGHFAAGPYGGDTYELDLAYAWNPGRRFSVLTDLALMFSVDEGEALTGIGHFGLGIQARIKDWWNLSLVARGGVAGSVDVGAVGAMYSVSLVSHIRYPIREYWFELRNMVGVANSIDGIKIDGIELDYDLTNVVLKNGISLNREFAPSSLSSPLRASVFFTQTAYFVDTLWLEYTHEVGAGVGLVGKEGISAYSPVSLDASYIFYEQYDALKLKLSLRF